MLNSICLRNFSKIAAKVLRAEVTATRNYNISSCRTIHEIKENVNQRYPTPLKSQENYQIRNITEKDFPRIMEIRKNLGTHDCYSCLQTWHTLDPNGIFIAENENGEIIGTVSFINYTDDYSAGGFFYVKPGMRNAGLGNKIFQTGVKHCHNRNIAGQIPIIVTKLYQSMTSVVFRESFTVMKHITPHDVSLDILSDKLPDNVTVHLFEEKHLQSLYDYDFKLLGINRRRFLELNCKEENSMTFVALKNENCVGYGTIKLSCLGARRVGPLYADEERIAEALLKTLFKSFSKGNGLVMLTLSSNLTASCLMKKLNVPSTQYLIPVFTKQLIDVDTDKVYAHFDVNSSVF